MATQKQIRNGKMCECSDTGCPVHKGSSACRLWHRFGQTVYRSDMEDRTGTKMCSECASDALESGVFSNQTWRSPAPVEMPCGHVVTPDRVRADWCSACEAIEKLQK